MRSKNKREPQSQRKKTKKKEVIKESTEVKKEINGIWSPCSNVDEEKKSYGKVKNKDIFDRTHMGSLNFFFVGCESSTNSGLVEEVIKNKTTQHSVSGVYNHPSRNRHGNVLGV